MKLETDRLYLEILDEKNLAGFKSRALERAKEFDVSNILPLYEAYYLKTIEKTMSTVKPCL